MLSWPELLVLAIAACVAAFVWDSLRAREAANDAMRRACEARGLFFLDDTVALASLGPARDADGRLRLRRVYRFAYSDTGHNRRRGHIALVGIAVEALELETPASQAGADNARGHSVPW